MNILLTGASGFVGRNLIPFIVSNKAVTIQNLNFRKELGSALPLSDALIHLAGKAHDLSKSRNDQEYLTVNYEKTKVLFDLFLKSDIRDFIYFSSVKAVADTVDGVLLENCPSEPKTPYGISKHEAEKYLLNQIIPEGKRVFILRPCMIHGPGNKGNLNLLYQMLERGIPYPLGAFNNRRSFLSIDNLLYILDGILSDLSIPGGVYNLSDDIPLSTNEVIEIIAEAMERKAKIWAIPKSLIMAVAKIGDTLNLPLSSERLKKLTESYVVSNEKIKAALRISDLPVISKDGLLKTIQSFKTQ